MDAACKIRRVAAVGWAPPTVFLWRRLWICCGPGCLTPENKPSLQDFAKLLADSLVAGTTLGQLAEPRKSLVHADVVVGMRPANHTLASCLISLQFAAEVHNGQN